MFISNKSNNLPPQYPTELSSCMDLRINTDEQVVIQPREQILVGCGVSFQLPPNKLGMLTTKGNLALEKQIVIVNAPVFIDNDYTKEVKLLLYNYSDQEQTIEPFDVIAKIAFFDVEQYDLQNVGDDIVDKKLRQEFGV